MSNFIVEEHRGISTGHHHHSNGYYAFTGPIVRTLPNPSPVRRPDISGAYTRVSNP